MAPYSTYIEQDWLIFALGGGKGLFAPSVPEYWLVHGGTKVRRRGLG
jgi:hypothetical protein